ncbi:hypothetical protein O181_072349 [Austropuccinia psidii MF-1]|uniref:Reverse transcriptase/retrotransposon-derived protein RNase H-like domain-containing protein n=1 Tax=Austropuccinia psidii MF-1 TaxID=1389203 RepID=A0A9Q3F4L2_9BASI|nr:hypothetical protein [Austropuccinia psidii MF-1]
MQYFLGSASYYRIQIRNIVHIIGSLYKLCSRDVVLEINKERRDAYERIKYELTNAPILILPDFELAFNVYVDAACIKFLGAAIYKRQLVDGDPKEGEICYISWQLKYSEAGYAATHIEFSFF